MAREKILHLRAHGRRRAYHALRRRQGPSGVLPGHRRSASLRGPRTRSSSTSSPTPPIRWRTRPTTGPEICEQMEADVDAVVVGVGSGGTLTGHRPFLRQGFAADRRWCWPIRSARSWRLLVETGQRVKAGGSWAVEGIGEDFVPPIADLSLVCEGLYDSGRESFATARDAAAPRRACWAARRPARCWPAALRYCREQTEPQARRDPRLRHRRASYLSKVYNDSLGGRAGPGRARAARRPARPDRSRRFPEGQAVTVRAGRHAAALRLQPHARGRRVAAAGARWTAGWSADRRERPAGAVSKDRRSGAFQPAGAQPR